MLAVMPHCWVIIGVRHDTGCRNPPDAGLFAATEEHSPALASRGGLLPILYIYLINSNI